MRVVFPTIEMSAPLRCDGSAYMLKANAWITRHMATVCALHETAVAPSVVTVTESTSRPVAWSEPSLCALSVVLTRYGNAGVVAAAELKRGNIPVLLLFKAERGYVVYPLSVT